MRTKSTRAPRGEGSLGGAGSTAPGHSAISRDRPFHVGDALSSQDAVSPLTWCCRGPRPHLGGEGQMPACPNGRCPLWTVGPKGPQALEQDTRGHKLLLGGLQGAWPWHEGSGARATVGAEGAWARESAFCGLSLKCMMVADGGRHAQPGDLTVDLLRPGLRRGAALCRDPSAGLCNAACAVPGASGPG